MRSRKDNTLARIRAHGCYTALQEYVNLRGHWGQGPRGINNIPLHTLLAWERKHCPGRPARPPRRRNGAQPNASELYSRILRAADKVEPQLAAWMRRKGAVLVAVIDDALKARAVREQAAPAEDPMLRGIWPETPPAWEETGSEQDAHGGDTQRVLMHTADPSVFVTFSTGSITIVNPFGAPTTAAVYWAGINMAESLPWSTATFAQVLREALEWARDQSRTVKALMRDTVRAFGTPQGTSGWALQWDDDTSATLTLRIEDYAVDVVILDIPSAILGLDIPAADIDITTPQSHPEVSAQARVPWTWDEGRGLPALLAQAVHTLRERKATDEVEEPAHAVPLMSIPSDEPGRLVLRFARNKGAPTPGVRSYKIKGGQVEIRHYPPDPANPFASKYGELYAFDGATPIGWLNASAAENSRVGFDIEVDALHRRRGVGSALLQAIERITGRSPIPSSHNQGKQASPDAEALWGVVGTPTATAPDLTTEPDDNYYSHKRQRERFTTIALSRPDGIHAPEGKLSRVALSMLETGELVRRGTKIHIGHRPGAPFSPVHAHPDELDKAATAQAFNGVSHWPERRGDSARREYAATFNVWAGKLRDRAEGDAAEKYVETEIANAKPGYLAAVRSYLGAKGSTTSWAITGPAGRNNRREGKKHDTADRRQQEAMEMLPKITKRVRKELETLRLETLGDRRENERQQLIADYNRITDTATTTSGQTPYIQKQILSLGRRIEALGGFGPARQRSGHGQRRQAGELRQAEARAAAGLHHGTSSTQARQLATRVATLQAREGATGESVHPFPAGVWTAGYPGTEHQHPEGTATLDFDADRVLLEFDECMTREAFRAIRSAGWKWSRIDELFKRQITANAIHSAGRIAGIKLPDISERIAAVQAAADAAAAAVQARAKAIKAQARAGQGTFGEVLTALMRKGSAFKLKVPGDIESPKAGKTISPSVRRGPTGGFVLSYKTDEPVDNPYGGRATMKGGRSFAIKVVRLGGGGVVVRLYASTGWATDHPISTQEVPGPESLASELVPAVHKAMVALVRSAGLDKAAPGIYGR